MWPKFRNINENHGWIVMESLFFFFYFLSLKVYEIEDFYFMFIWENLHKEMWAKGQFRYTGSTEGWIQRGQGKNKDKILQSILGTSRSRAEAEEAIREDIFCRITEPGANQILRKNPLCGIRAKQEIFSRCKESGTEGSFFLEWHHFHFSSGVLLAEVQSVLSDSWSGWTAPPQGRADPEQSHRFHSASCSVQIQTVLSIPLR